jgi:hypothetical protein
MVGLITPVSKVEDLADILRYWLSAVRFEEALTIRPRAHRVRPGISLDIRDPQGRQPYFKLPLFDDGVALALKQEMTTRAEITGERIPFTEQWIRRMYRRQRNRWTVDQASFGGVVGWPAIYFPRSQELATVFRFPASLEWFNGDNERFEPPRYRDRKAGVYPPEPTSIKIDGVMDEDAGLLPFSLDDRLLTQSLGIADEELADLYEVLRSAETLTAQDMVATVTHLLNAPADWTPQLVEASDDDREVMTAALDAISHRLKSGRHMPVVYPISLVYDGAQIQTTHHLQRDLALMLERLRPSRESNLATPLNRYLSGSKSALGWAPMAGQYATAPMTGEQRAIAEGSLGSKLVAAQGPPGTGKTRLIIDLGAARLVERVRTLATDGKMGNSLLVVCSTNNRAVDNVFDTFQEAVLPLGLRAGSQNVTSTRTASILHRVLGWLDARPHTPPDADQGQLHDTLAQFKRLDESLVATESERYGVRRVAARIVHLDRRISEIESLVNPNEAPDSIDRTNLRTGQRLLDRLAPRLTGLINRLEQGSEALDEVRLHWAETRRRYCSKMEVDLPQAFSFEFTGPPKNFDGSPDGYTEQWLALAVDDQERLDDLRESMREALRQTEMLTDLVELRRERATLADNNEIDTGQDAELALRHKRLYEQAEVVRTAWAILHRKDLYRAIKTAFEAASQRRSLRRLLGDDLVSGRWLRQLFPMIGSTLLSLGNVFPARGEQFDQLVIDEGGQCHPAYAISGLLRCNQALVIGDVHQLEPVVQLSSEDESRVRRAARVNLALADLEPYRIGIDKPNSAQLLADRAMKIRPSLHSHFRCQPQIIRVCDALCDYALRVCTDSVDSPPIAWLPNRVTLIPVTGNQERIRGSWCNMVELKVVTALLNHLRSAGVGWQDIAVITPYVGQLERLREMLRQLRIPWQGAQDFEDFAYQSNGIALGTVHRFQGGERRFVIFSTVVTRTRSLSFLNRRVNLVNVAVSRAREQLFTVGHGEILSQGRFTRILMDHAHPVESSLKFTD